MDDEVTECLCQIFGDDVDLEKLEPMKFVKAVLAKGKVDVKKAVEKLRSLLVPAGSPTYPKDEFGKRWRSRSQKRPLIEPQLWLSLKKQKYST